MQHQNSKLCQYFSYFRASYSTLVCQYATLTQPANMQVHIGLLSDSHKENIMFFIIITILIFFFNNYWFRLNVIEYLVAIFLFVKVMQKELSEDKNSGLGGT